MPQLDSLDRSRVSSAKLLSVVVDGDYYGGSSAAVPFKWESQPGTPIRLFKRSSASGFDSDSDFSSPVSAPLTPPPSYFSASPSSTKPKRANVRSGSLVNKNRSGSVPSSPVASSSSSSSSISSVPSSPLRTSDSYGRNSRRSVLYGSRHYNAKSSGCYGSIIKMFLRDVK